MRRVPSLVAGRLHALLPSPQNIAARPLSNPAAPPASPTISPAMFQAIRNAIAKENADATTAGLAAAVQRQVAGLRPGAIGAAEAGDDLQASANDSRELGLAKAVARLCIGQVGIAKSARAIEAVRALKGGSSLRSPQGISTSRPAPRVLGAARRT